MNFGDFPCFPRVTPPDRRISGNEWRTMVVVTFAGPSRCVGKSPVQSVAGRKLATKSPKTTLEVIT